jgi:glutaredoxin 3
LLKHRHFIDSQFIINSGHEGEQASISKPFFSWKFVDCIGQHISLGALLPNEPNGGNPQSNPNIETESSPPLSMVNSPHPPVVIWTGRGCGACAQAKQFLGRKQVEFNERRLKSAPSTQRAFARATGGARTVPQILIGDHIVGGFDDLLQLEKSGELDVLLGRAEPVEAQSLFTRLGRMFGRKAP